MENTSGLIALVGDAPHAWTMVNALRKKFSNFPVIVERGEPASAFWARRKKKLGAAAGTTSLQFITDVIKPDTEPFAFNSNADAKTALDNKQIDAIISDLPTAIYWSAAGSANGGIDNTTVFGQFPLGSEGGPEALDAYLNTKSVSTFCG